MLPHPILGAATVCVPYLVCIPGHRGDQVADIGYRAAAKMDLVFGEEVSFRGQETAWTFAGITMDGSAQFIDGPGKLHIAQSIPTRAGVDLKSAVSGRSGGGYFLRDTEEALRPFGVYAGERIAHPDLGRGTVRGVYGGHLFLQWEGEEGISTGLPESLLDLYRLISIESPIGRVVVTVVIEEASIPVQVEPCPILTAYGFIVNDIVATSQITAIVVGEFSVHAVVRDLISEETVLVLPSQIELIARQADQPVLVSKRFFDRPIVEVDVSYRPDDELRPGDRIYSEKGFATVLGRSNTAFVVQSDEAFRLNLGAIEYSGKWRLIRRIDVGTPRWFTFLPGDILANADGQKSLLTYREGSFFFESPTAVAQPAPDSADQISLITRADCRAQRIVPIVGTKAVFNVNMREFRGWRVCPGDLVEVDGETFSVIGLRNEYIWINPCHSGHPLVLAQQAFLDPTIVKITARVDDFQIGL
jgi:hypothetical protein